jgi:hypothetical protein
MGFGRADGWARAGAGKTFGLGPGGKDEFLLFSEIIFNAKTIPAKTRNCLKARKILRKTQNFHENSQR